MRHVMKIGPFATEADGEMSAYVAFGASGMDAAVEHTDAAGLAALIGRAKREKLVCEPALAHAAAERGMAVAQLPFEALAMKAAMAVKFDHPGVLDDVSPPLILDLITAMVELDEAQPWDVFEPDEPIEIRVQRRGREVVEEGCIMGQAGEQFGFALYRQRGSIDRIVELTMQGRHEAARMLGATTLLLEDQSSYVVDAVKAMTGAALAPVVCNIDGGKLRPAPEQDVAALVAAVRAVTALALGEDNAEGQSRAYANGREQRVVARARRLAARNGENLEELPRSIYEGVGRNHPCPCGSGKKFKRCHFGSNEASSSSLQSPSSTTRARPAVHDRDERIVADILAFGAKQFGKAALSDGVRELFGDHDVSEQLALPMLAYGWPVDGKPLAAHFLDANRGRLSGGDRAWIELQVATRLSVWEVLRVERGRGVQVVDLLSGQRCFVHEIMGSQMLRFRDAVLGRVVMDEPAVFCGIHERMLSPRAAAAVVERARAAGLGPDDATAGARLIALWHEQLAEAERKAATPMKITNTDGHEVAHFEDRFSIVKGRVDAVFDALAAIDGAIVADRDRTGARITFTRPGNAIHAGWENTIVGSARLTPTRIVVSTNSVERARELSDRIRAVLGDLVKWQKRTSEAPAVMYGGETVSIDAQALDASSARDVVRGWLDSPVPALGGRTPRKAVTEESGRRVVHQLLKEMEHHHARGEANAVDRRGRRTEDEIHDDVDVASPAALRKELGLDEVGEPMTVDRLELDRALGAGRKLSETLLEFVQPMLDGHPGRIDERSMRTMLGFAIHIWNAIVTEQACDAPMSIAEVRAAFVADGIPAELLRWFDLLCARKRERFAGDRRMVGKWTVRRTGDRLDVEMESRVPAALYARLTEAGLLA